MLSQQAHRRGRVGLCSRLISDAYIRVNFANISPRLFRCLLDARVDFRCPGPFFAHGIIVRAWRATIGIFVAAKQAVLVLEKMMVGALATDGRKQTKDQ